MLTKMKNPLGGADSKGVFHLLVLTVSRPHPSSHLQM